MFSQKKYLFLLAAASDWLKYQLSSLDLFPPTEVSHQKTWAGMFHRSGWGFFKNLNKNLFSSLQVQTFSLICWIQSTLKKVPWLHQTFHFAEKLMTIDLRFSPLDKILSLTLLFSWINKNEIISELCKRDAGRLLRNCSQAAESEKRELAFRRAAIWKSIHQASETPLGFGRRECQTLCVSALSEEMCVWCVCVCV